MASNIPGESNSAPTTITRANNHPGHTTALMNNTHDTQTMTDSDNFDKNNPHTQPAASTPPAHLYRYLTQSIERIRLVLQS